VRASLRYYRRTHLAVGAAVAVATAVLVGALLVGDAMRAGLRRQALARLGAIDVAVVSEAFFPAAVARRLAAELAAGGGAAAPGSAPGAAQDAAPDPARDGTPASAAETTPDPVAGPAPESGRAAQSARSAQVAPVILLQGTAHHPTGGKRASGVGIHGVDGSFTEVFGTAEPLLESSQRTVFPPVWINATLAAELGAAAGDDVVLGVPRWSEIPSASLLAKRDAGDLVRTLRVTVAGVLADDGVGVFGLAPATRPVRNAFLRRSDLGRALGRPDEVNALLLGPHWHAGAVLGAGSENEGSAAAAATVARTVEEALAAAVSVGDLGLRLAPRGAALELGSRAFLLPPAAVDAATSWAREAGLLVQPSFAYLANRIAMVGVAAPAIPYSSVLALDPAQLLPGAALVRLDGAPLASIGEDEVWLSPWAAEDLGLSPEAAGTVMLELDAFVVGPGDQLVEQRTALRFGGVVAFTGAAADRTLLPEVPGISDARNLREWEAPFPFELARVRPQDEAYWETWGPTPKAFVALATGARLWGSRHGSVTSLRFALAPPAGGPAGEGDTAPATAAGVPESALAGAAPSATSGGRDHAASALAERLGRGLLARTSPSAYGWQVLAVRDEVLEASAGSSDFAGLFVAFSFFVLVSAWLLVALLFSLGVESRAREAGTLVALGFPLARVRRRFLAEGLLVAAAGCAAGVPFGVVYAAGLLWALETLWREAIGGVRLALVVAPGSLVAGALIALLAAALAIVLRLRALVRTAPRRLLAGELVPERPLASLGASSAGRWGRWRLAPALAVGATAVAAMATVGMLLGGGPPSPGLAFLGGGSLLVAGLAALAWWCARRDPARGGGSSPASGLVAMALAGTARQPGRTRIATALIAVAVFVLGVVAASRHGVEQEVGRDGGLGGYRLAVSADVPVLRDLAEPGDRELLGFDDAGLEALAEATVMPFVVVPGDDASCLNLYRPQRPRLLGVAPAFIDRGGFRFAGAVEEVANPWELLRRDLGPGVIPAIGDASSVQWILHKGLGQDVELRDERGEPVRLRIVATLSRSLFQSELLVAEEALLRHFPSRGGGAFFLVDAAGETEPVSAALEEGLAPYGVDAVPAADRLAAYLAVEATYMTAFGGLGGLGLLLGTLGLAVLLLRGAAERRSELAALAAFGFPRRRLRLLLAGESLVLLGFGTALGLAAAALAVLPSWLQHGGHMPWRGLLLTIAAVWAIGLATNTWAAARALPKSLLAAMRGE
jgi:putative ABC transport system permease protein